MLYQDFLQVAGIRESSLSESDYLHLIEPAMQDRRDLFPTDEAVIAYYHNFGLDGFSDDFFSTLDNLMDALDQAKRMTGVTRQEFLKLVELAVDQI